MTNLQQQFENHYRVITSAGFLQRQGLANEVPFFISTFSADQQVEAEGLVNSLFMRLQTQGVDVLKIDLFELCLELLEQQGVLEDYLAMESQIKKADLKDALVGALSVQDKIAPAIARKLAEQNWKVLFLCGVGRAYPILRTHTVLSNLQSIVVSQPTVLFFPGRYTFVDGSGASLDLFGNLNEERYYRAFNLNNYQLQQSQ
ncbi:MAG: hypothetical protein CL923_04720 [Deltaproteobacteria bacterium]|nr:hypothetical protein [Deltaproteobacteria bacterium]